MDIHLTWYERVFLVVAILFAFSAIFLWLCHLRVFAAVVVLGDISGLTQTLATLSAACLAALAFILQCKTYRLESKSNRINYYRIMLKDYLTQKHNLISNLSIKIQSINRDASYSPKEYKSEEVLERIVSDHWELLEFCKAKEYKPFSFEEFQEHLHSIIQHCGENGTSVLEETSWLASQYNRSLIALEYGVDRSKYLSLRDRLEEYVKEQLAKKVIEKWGVLFDLLFTYRMILSMIKEMEGEPLISDEEILNIKRTIVSGMSNAEKQFVYKLLAQSNPEYKVLFNQK